MATKGDLNHVVTQFWLAEFAFKPNLTVQESEGFRQRVHQVATALCREQGLVNLGRYDWRRYMMLLDGTELGKESTAHFRELQAWLGHHSAKPPKKD